MRKNIFLILLVAAIFVFVGTVHQSAKAVDDPVQFIKNAKTPVHFHSLAGGVTCIPGISDSLINNQASMVGTWWHSICPTNTFSAFWKVQAQIDNGTFGLNPSDKLKMGFYTSYPPGTPGDSLWVHVEDVTITQILKRTTFPFDTMYLEYTGGYDSLGYPILNPVSTRTWWEEGWPSCCPYYYHIDSIAPPTTPFDTLRCCKYVKLNTIGLSLKRVFAPGDTSTLYLEFTGGTSPDSINRALNNPVCTWWRGIWPDSVRWRTPADTIPVYCWYFHIDSINPGPPLQTCRNILLRRDGTPTPDDTTWWHVENVVVRPEWHVEDVAIDIEVLSIPDPTVPTMTQWGIIILVALLIGSGVFVMLRRRKAAVPA